MKKTFTSKSDKVFAKAAKPKGLHSGTKKRFLLFAVAFLCSYFIRAQYPTVLTPSVGSNSIACGQNSLLEDAFGATFYVNNMDGYTVIYPGNGSAVHIAGTYTTESGYDYVRIYNGVGTGGTQLQSVSGTGTINFTGAVGQTVTVRFSSDVSVTYNGMQLNVTFAGPCSTVACSGPPASNTILPAYQNVTICPSGNMGLSLANSYDLPTGFFGYTYQWMSSTVSPVGPWNSIPSATNSAFTATNTSNLLTYYTAVITCTNGNSTSTAVSAPVYVAPTITNSVPYYEDFESIVVPGMLPNCSWSVSSTADISTYTSATAGYLFGQNSSHFMSFNGANTNVKYAYTNGIQLYPGVTYSAAANYLTEYSGLTNFTDLSLLLGTTQSSTGLVPLASTNGAAVAPQYSLLSHTFQVNTAGIYYLAIRVTNAAGSDHLSIDNVSITMPCSYNSPTMSVAGLSVACVGNPVNLTATGADTYSWNTGSTLPNISYATTQPGLMNFVVVGTNSLSNCTTTVVKTVNVLAGPVVSPFTNDPNNGVCPGQTAVLYAVGSAIGYTWSTTGLPAANTTVAPTSNTTYTVLGSNATGCVTSATIAITIKDAPAVSATASKATICSGEGVILTGSDNNLSYQWVSNAILLTGNPATAYPLQPTNFQVTGTDPSTGCSGTALVAVNVVSCLGVNNIVATASGIAVYPNPNNGEFTVALNNNTVKSISVVDVTGRILLSNTNATTGNVNFNINHLAAGVYYVKVQSDKQTEVIKVVKQ